jgi:hypothetical protein
MSTSSPPSRHPVRGAFFEQYKIAGTSHSLAHHALTGPWVTSVGGTMNRREPRRRRASPAADSRITSCASPTRATLFPTSSQDWTSSIMATTSGFGAVTRPDRFLLRNLRSPWGRGIPDISAQALNYMIVNNKILQPWKGTSCSVPVRFSPSPPPCTQLTTNVQTVAGIVSLLTARLTQPLAVRWRPHRADGHYNQFEPGRAAALVDSPLSLVEILYISSDPSLHFRG